VIGRLPAATARTAATAGKTTATTMLTPTMLLLGAMAGILMMSPLSILVVLTVLLVWSFAWLRAGWLVLAGALALAAVIYLAGDPMRLAAIGWWATWQTIGPDRAPWQAAIGPWLLTGGPVGLLLAGLIGSWSEYSTRHAEWYGWQQRRAVIVGRRRLAHARRASSALTDKPEVSGVLVERTAIDRTAYRVRPRLVVGRYALAGRSVPLRPMVGWSIAPTDAGRRQSRLLLGSSGSGKTEDAVRAVRDAAEHGWRIVVIDAKALDPGIGARLLTAFEQGQPGGRWGVFPDQPIDIWRADPDRLVGRLLDVLDHAESGPGAYYRDAAQRLLQLVCGGPAGPPQSSDAFTSSLSLAWVRRTWGDELAEELTGDAVSGAILRYRGYWHEAAGRFDGGWSWEDQDLSVALVRSLGNRRNADATVRLLLADVADFVSFRQDGTRPTLLVLDEVGAVPGARDLIIDLVERGRAAGVTTLLLGQSFASFGSDHDVDRLVGAVGGRLTVHQVADPERVLRYVGTDQAPDRSWQTAGYGTAEMSGSLRLRAQPRIDPNRLREATRGHGWLIANGHPAELVGARTAVDPAAAGKVAERLDDVVTPATVHLSRIAEAVRELAPPPPAQTAPEAVSAAPGRPELPAAALRAQMVPTGLRSPVGAWWAPFVLWVRALVARLPRRVRRG
jgi:hypothetical protein